MNPWLVLIAVVGVAVILPLVASILMAMILETANNEGLYDDED